MNKNNLFVLAMLFSLCGNAQVINGDLDEDNDVTMNDAVLLVNDYLTNSRHYVQGTAADPFAIDNSTIVGKWYETKTESITFNADGTTDYGTGYKYEFLPFQGHILIYNQSGAPVNALYVMKKTADTMILRSCGSNVFKNYSKAQPVQLVTGITLSVTEITLSPNTSQRLAFTISPSNATNKIVKWSSSNESVAKVSDGLIYGMSTGTAIVTVTATDGSGVKATCKVTVTSSNAMQHYGREYVDLGTGVKWATMNIGADSPEDYGYYIAWGATKPQSYYDWPDCPYQIINTPFIDKVKFTKYLGSTSSSDKAGSATDENALKTVLDPEDDAAHVNWGGDWRMPTYEELEKLRTECFWVWVTSYKGKSVNGYVVYKAKTDNDKGEHTKSGEWSYYYSTYDLSDPHIFLPFAGYNRGVQNLYEEGERGLYWSSTVWTGAPATARQLGITSDNVYINSKERCIGNCVRAVCP